MISGVHSIVLSKEADRARAFFRDVIGWSSVDAGDGWLIFGLPPAELAVHPTDGDGHHELYLMCDDISGTVAELESRGIEFVRPVSDEGWGLLTAFKVPGGGEMGLYEPRHPTALRQEQ